MLAHLGIIRTRSYTLHVPDSVKDPIRQGTLHERGKAKRVCNLLVGVSKNFKLNTLRH